MPFYVELLTTIVPPGAPSSGVVRAGLPEMDDCKIFTRLKAFVVDQGVVSTLEHVFRDRKGNPVDLSEWFGAGTSQSASSSGTPAGTLKLRIKEWLGVGSGAHNPVWTSYGEAWDASAGIVRAELPEKSVERAGIYELNWAVINETGKTVLVDRGIMSIEKSLFASDLNVVQKGEGPPTLQEIRMRLMDSSASENTLLDDVEFKDEQILQAILEPVRLWNETPPPIRTFTTSTFPFRGAWMTGVMAQLHLTMAAHFRRNVLKTANGGGADKDKEREYLAEGQRLWGEYTAWLLNKKVSINLKGFVGSSPSPYSGGNGW